MNKLLLPDVRGWLRLRGGKPALRLLFSGDLCPVGRLERMLLAGDLVGAFGDTLGLFAAADLAVVNLEAPLCRTEAPIFKCGPNFRAAPRVARTLAAAGVDVCCLANNHIMDQGPAGLRGTLAALDAAGLRHVGAGQDQTVAGGPFLLKIRGIRLALLNFAIVEGALAMDGPGAARLDRLEARRAVARAAGPGRVVLPILHAGREEVLFPAPGFRALCRELLDAGAAAVVAHHPHVPQGIELHRGRPIAYSLGNFLFDWHEPEPHTDSSFLLELGITRCGVVELALHPFRKGAKGGAELLKGQARTDYLKFLRDISEPFGNETSYRRLWTEQCRKLLDSCYRQRLARGADIRSPRCAVRLRAGLTLLNLLEEDEHGEPLKEALRAEVLGRSRVDRPARRQLDALGARLRAFASKRLPGKTILSRTGGRRGD